VISLRTPASVDAAVLQLRDLIRPDAEPRYLRIAPEPDCERQRCFENVRRKVDRDGGASVVGWALWIWPHVFIEAEHHVVYRPADGGAWRDVTPPDQPSTKRRLFLPDPSATYREDMGAGRRDNIRLALCDDPMVGEIFAAAELRTRIWRSAPGADAASEAATLAALEAAEFAQSRAQVRLAMKYTPPRAACFCGSGRMFRGCHGRVTG
jgi:hypothetical protein